MHDDAPVSDPLSKAAAAAKTGDVIGTIELLYASGVLDGMAGRLRRDWKCVEEEDSADLIISDAVDQLYVALQSGRRVESPAGYLWRIAERKASRAQHDFDQRHRAEAIFQQHHEAQSDEARQHRRAEALKVARRLLPRLGQTNSQHVLAYIFDAIEAGRGDISYQEIADALGLTSESVRKSWQRGFDRLSRIVHDEGLVPLEIVAAEEGEYVMQEEEVDGSTD